MTPGWKSTEYWTHAAVVILGLLLASGVLPATWQNALGLLAAALASHGYSTSRGNVKAAAATAAPALAAMMPPPAPAPPDPIPLRPTTGGKPC